MLLTLDHVNIRTSALEPMRKFYAEALGLADGARPPFGFGGAWLYCGQQAAVHLVEVANAPAGVGPRIEHFAFRASGLADFLARLRRLRHPYSIALVPGNGNRQVNIFDPDGNHIEVQFEGSEQADVSTYTP